MRIGSSKSGWLMAALLCVFSCLAYGQAADGILVGTITDQAGAAVPNVNVELTNIDTGVVATAKTDAAGQYRFNNVPVGKYKVTATITGFQTATVQNLAIELNRVATVNLSLQVGTVSTTVEVTEATATIDTTTANVSNSFGRQQIVQLPTTGLGQLGVINLSLLSAGVASSGGVGYGTGPSVGGQRPTNNNFMIEGVDNNNRSVTGPIVNVPVEAIAEFSLQQNQFSPEFGHSTGGQFNTVVKSGSNQMRGTAYLYNQNRNFAAIDQSAARQGFTKNPRYDQNRYGGNFGGPVIKNKWFYFGNLQYQPIGTAAVASSAIFVPTQAGIQTLDRISGLNRTNLDQFKKYVPLAAAPAVGQTTTVRGEAIPLGIFQAQGPSFTNYWDYLVSSDYYISPKDQIRARYLYNKQDQIDPTANIPTFFTPIKLSNHLANLTWFRSITPGLTNELRLGYNRRVDDRPAGDFQFPGLDAFPNLQFNDLGLIVGPRGTYPQSTRSNTFQLSNNVNWITGRHTFKFGYDGRKLNSSNFFVQRNRGDYQYNSLERYLLDITPEFAQRSTGGAPFIGNLVSHYLFANDEFKLRPNLTLSAGVRYEWVGVPYGAKQQSLNAISSVPGLLEFRSPNGTALDFAPRVGLAWSPGKDGKTSIRAGFGMGYDQVYQNLGNNSLPPQFFTTIDAHIDRANQPNFLGSGAIPNLAAPITNPATARRATSSFIPDQIRPYSLQWNFGIQRVVARDYTVEVRYLGSRGVRLPYQVQMNRPSAVARTGQQLPVFTQRPTQAQLDALNLTVAGIQAAAPVDPLVAAGFTTSITTFLPVGNSTYHGLATQINRRFSNGLQFIGAYTWSHNIDDSTAALFSTVTSPRRPEDFQNLRRERASSALDRRHRLSISGLYDLPFFKQGTGNWALKNLVGNWVFSGAYIAETGPWATVRSGVDSNLNGDNAGDRTLLNVGGDMSRSSGVTPLCRGTGACTTAQTARIVGWLVNDPTAGYWAAGQGVMPTAGRNTLRLPGINNFDLSLAKRFNLGEARSIEFRAESYNAFNHPQFTPGYPSAANLRSRTDGGSTALLLAGNGLFNKPSQAFESNARVVQFVLRVQF